MDALGQGTRANVWCCDCVWLSLILNGRARHIEWTDHLPVREDHEFTYFDTASYGWVMTALAAGQPAEPGWRGDSAWSTFGPLSVCCDARLLWGPWQPLRLPECPGSSGMERLRASAGWSLWGTARASWSQMSTRSRPGIPWTISTFGHLPILLLLNWISIPFPWDYSPLP